MTSETGFPTQTVRMRGPLSGWLLFALSKVLGEVIAPGLGTSLGLKRAIAKNRAAGTARPGRMLRRRFVFREELDMGEPVFYLSPKDSDPVSTHFLYLHGGAFVLDMQSIQWSMPAGLLDHVPNSDVTLPIYPLAPESSWRETMSFVVAIYEKMVGRYGAENIVVCGDSAGGTLSILLAQAIRDRGGPQPASVVLFSPLLDGSASADDQPALERRSASIPISLIRNCIAMWAPDLDPKDPRISALYGSQQDLAPILVFSGDREVLDSDARRLALINPNVDHRSYAEMGHVFPIGGIREGRHAFEQAAIFIGQNVPR